MIRNKWSVGMRNQLSSLAMACDSSAAIEGAKMSPKERKVLQDMLMGAVDWIDNKIRP